VAEKHGRPRSSQGRRRALLLAVLGCALLLAGWLVWGLAGGPGDPAEDSADRATPVEASLGEPADLHGVQVVLNTFGPTAQPTLPASTLEPDLSPAPAGKVFYQARLLVTNGSDLPAWLDPADFTLQDGEGRLYIDPSRSGPRPRALLPTASLSLILTFPGPEGLDAPVLEFRPPWYAGGLKVEASAPESGSSAAGAA
jgi:hypothetical protein